MCFANLTLAKFPLPIVFISLYFPILYSSVAKAVEDELDISAAENYPVIIIKIIIVELNTL